MLRLLLASEDGYLYVYSLDVAEGGDCALIRQFHLSKKDEHTFPNSPEAVKMEQQQLEATNNEDLASGSGADQVDSANPLDKSPKSLSESKILPSFQGPNLNFCSF